jgi:hypothetical protein
LVVLDLDQIVLPQHGGQPGPGPACKSSSASTRSSRPRRPRPVPQWGVSRLFAARGPATGLLPDLLPNHSRQPETRPDTRPVSLGKRHPFDRFNSTIRDVIRPIATLSGGFRDRPVRPLRHLSAMAQIICAYNKTGSQPRCCHPSPFAATHIFRFRSTQKAPVPWTGGDGFRRETIAQTASVTLRIDEIRMRSRRNRGTARSSPTPVSDWRRRPLSGWLAAVTRSAAAT